MKRDFLNLLECTGKEIGLLLDRASELKAMHGRGEKYYPLEGKTIGLLFTKPSTRTRLSFEVGVYHLGGHISSLQTEQLQIGRGESIKDTARVISRYLDALVIRTGAHCQLEEFAKNSDIPIINGLSDDFHPCQVIADLLTIREKKGNEKDVKIAYVGDGNNIANSLLCAAAVLDLNLVVVSPPDYSVKQPIIDQISKIGKGTWRLTDDLKDGVSDADVVMTDVWISMGQEKGAVELKTRTLSAYQVNKELLALAKPDAIVLHCLPAHKGEEITEEVFEGPQSAIFEQAENRLHGQKAILEWLL